MTLRSPKPAVAAGGARCPVCGKPATAESRPFCSLRCADIDLGRWLTGQYRLPGEPPQEADADPDREP
jgi:hypothetical protein